MPGIIVDQWQKMLFCVAALSGQWLMCEVFSILTKEVLSSATKPGMQWGQVYNIG